MTARYRYVYRQVSPSLYYMGKCKQVLNVSRYETDGGDAMKAQVQMAMVKAADPRVVRMVLVGLAVVLALVAPMVPGGVQVVLADPAMGGGGSVGG